MCDPSNPFAALIQDSSDEKISPKNPVEKPGKEIEFEDVFGFTLDKSASKRRQLVYLEELAKTFNARELDFSTLEHALFERLFLSNPKEFVYCDTELLDSDLLEEKVIVYLFNCYRRTNDLVKGQKTRADVFTLILRNATTALKQPDLYYNQDIIQQLYDILDDNSDISYMFFDDVCHELLKDDEGIEAVKEPFFALLKVVHVEIAKSSITAISPKIWTFLQYFASREAMAELFLEYCAPKEPVTAGIRYSDTLLGALFSISILPKVPNASYEFFTNPLDHSSLMGLEPVLWSNSDKLCDNIHAVIKILLKCSPNVKDKTMAWLGGCLKANADRGKIWNSHAPMALNPATYTSVSDGFMLNLGNVLLRLCQPFCANIKEGRILKVDPTYCAVTDDKCEEKGIHLPQMSKETCLIPASDDDSENQERVTSSHYSFMTECFYMTHRCIDLGFRVIIDHLVSLNQDMGRIERAYNDAVANSGAMTDVAEAIKDRMKTEMSKYLSIKSALCEPNLLQMMFNFISSTSYWLTQVALHPEPSNGNFAPLNEMELSFPLPRYVPETLKCIPELVIENVVCFLVFLKRFQPRIFEEQGYDRMCPIMSFILSYMGTPARMKNPHLRARLAEGLETLLPVHNEPAGLNPLGRFQREKLFLEHPHRKEIVWTLLSVFVGIEMTGESVQFEQKFNYRRPMYLVMDYIWSMEEYQNHFRELAEEAEANMEAVSPPLFLRFVNLLLNDAVFLLDEALSNMARIRTMNQARENGEWNGLPANERAQNMAFLQQTGAIARFNNILARDTIKTLERLTGEIKIVFTHPTMVDRVAAMLNYFLCNLVGPKKKNFKVKDRTEYGFDPADAVLSICTIYVNLMDSDSFCLAISRDGRSYSPHLFTQADEVLVRIGGGMLIGALQELAARVIRKAEEQKANDEAFVDAPDHFLDPIMSTVMTDPVILPSSRQTVDRSTIARHLLSDQTDPFNRAPLTMDQVIPNTELAAEIQQWLEERRK